MHKFRLLVLACALFLTTVIPPSLPIHTHAEQLALTDYIVTGEILHLREGPGLSFPIIETLKQGQTLQAIKKETDWIHVQKGDIQGWVASWLVEVQAKEGAIIEDDAARTVISQVNDLNLRAEPSLSAAVLTRLPSGTEAQFIKQLHDWIQIQYGDFTGWVSATYVSINNTTTEMPKDPIASPERDKGQSKVVHEQTISSATNDPNTFTISVDAVNIRKKANLTSKKLGVAKKGKQYKVLDRQHNWVQIEYTEKKKGWIYSFYGTFTVQSDSIEDNDKQQSNPAATSGNVTIIYNGTNLREEASTASNVVTRVNAGETFPIIETVDNWHKIQVSNEEVAYVADWVITTNTDNTAPAERPKEARKKGSLKGVTIVLDPGHGGNDHGTTGVRGTAEKNINTLTAELLKSKLRAAGAEVILTRESDIYVDLRKRVAISHQAAADAFISIHYDANEDSSVTGFTTYYTNSYQQELADNVHAGLADKVDIRDRGVKAGNYLVLRENRQKAILIELGYLSNANEERSITTDYYREQATLGIYQGILDYFDARLEQ